MSLSLSLLNILKIANTFVVFVLIKLIYKCINVYFTLFRPPLTRFSLTA